jgi:hypothetical protein
MSDAPERIVAWKLDEFTTVGQWAAEQHAVSAKAAGVKVDGATYTRADIAEAEAATLRAKLAEARADALQEAAEIVLDWMPATQDGIGDIVRGSLQGAHDAILSSIAEDAK